MTERYYRCAIGELSPTGEGGFNGTAIEYGVLLQGLGIVLTPGAFDAAIAELQDGAVPFIKGHRDYDGETFGVAKLTSTPQAVMVEGEYHADDESQGLRQRMAHLSRYGLANLSMGFWGTSVREYEQMTDAERNTGAMVAVDEARPQELSYVLWGASPGAEAKFVAGRDMAGYANELTPAAINAIADVLKEVEDHNASGGDDSGLDTTDYRGLMIASRIARSKGARRYG